MISRVRREVYCDWSVVKFADFDWNIVKIFSWKKDWLLWKKCKKFISEKVFDVTIYFEVMMNNNIMLKKWDCVKQDLLDFLFPNREYEKDG